MTQRRARRPLVWRKMLRRRGPGRSGSPDRDKAATVRDKATARKAAEAKRKDTAAANRLELVERRARAKRQVADTMCLPCHCVMSCCTGMTQCCTDKLCQTVFVLLCVLLFGALFVGSVLLW